ncbi:MAG: hypothetical protein WB818_08100 [Desulfobacterales bacterium]
MVAPADAPSVCILFPCAQSRLGFERFAHERQPRIDPCTFMRGLEGSLGQLGDPLHVFAKGPPTLWAGGQTYKSLNCAEHPQHDGEIAFGIAPEFGRTIPPASFRSWRLL